MAWRIHDHVVRGEIDNRTRGRVTGRIWLAGRFEPIVLQLTGNCLRDLAGCLMQFENPSPTAGDTSSLNCIQQGVAGDITASRKVRVLDVPVEEAMRLGKKGLPIPDRQANCLYLEWYSATNGRIVIESTDCKITLTTPEWALTPDEEQRQMEANIRALRDFLQTLGHNLSPHEFAPGDDKPMNEFEYEKFLRDCDSRSELYGELLEKYGEQPGGDAIIDREMGWESWDDDDPAAENEQFSAEFPDVDEAEPPEPDPATEGVDWIRDASGHIHHPFCERVSSQRAALRRFCKEHGHLSDDGSDTDVHEMLFEYQTMGAKLAGALNSLGYRSDTSLERGGIVARLKRALNHLHLSMSAAEKVAAKNILPADRLAAFRQEQFADREEILALMKRFREGP